MAYKPQDPFAKDIISTAAPQSTPMLPAYNFGTENTRDRHRWDVTEWRKRAWAFLVAGLAFIILIVVVVVMEVKKWDTLNRYQDYAPLNYSLSDSCAYHSFLFYQY